MRVFTALGSTITARQTVHDKRICGFNKLYEQTSAGTNVARLDYGREMNERTNGRKFNYNIGNFTALRKRRPFKYILRQK